MRRLWILIGSLFLALIPSFGFSGEVQLRDARGFRQIEIQASPLESSREIGALKDLAEHLDHQADLNQIVAQTSSLVPNPARVSGSTQATNAVVKLIQESPEQPPTTLKEKQIVDHYERIWVPMYRTEYESGSTE